MFAHHETLEWAHFYLKMQGQNLAELEVRHTRFDAVIVKARASAPTDER